MSVSARLKTHTLPPTPILANTAFGTIWPDGVVHVRRVRLRRPTRKHRQEPVPARAHRGDIQERRTRVRRHTKHDPPDRARAHHAAATRPIPWKRPSAVAKPGRVSNTRAGSNGTAAGGVGPPPPPPPPPPPGAVTVVADEGTDHGPAPWELIPATRNRYCPAARLFTVMWSFRRPSRARRPTSSRRRTTPGRRSDPLRSRVATM